jgi:hypothetical protein
MMTLMTKQSMITACFSPTKEEYKMHPATIMNFHGEKYQTLPIFSNFNFFRCQIQ